MAVQLYQFYKETVIPTMRAKHGYKNIHQVPRVQKVVVNTCVNANTDVKQGLEDAKAEIMLITGQMAAETRSKKSIANFKLRQHQPIGAKVTLRGSRMYEFLETKHTIEINKPVPVATILLAW